MRVKKTGLNFNCKEIPLPTIPNSNIKASGIITYLSDTPYTSGANKVIAIRSAYDNV